MEARDLFELSNFDQYEDSPLEISYFDIGEFNLSSPETYSMISPENSECESISLISDFMFPSSKELIESNKPKIEHQIDYILSTTRENRKLLKKSKKEYKRNIKSRDQKAILFKELIGNSIITKEKIRQVALSLGLKEMQVYKWYWDHKRRSHASH